jgi:hypothetical protein
MSDIGNRLLQELNARRLRISAAKQAYAHLTNTERREFLAEMLESEESVGKFGTGPTGPTGPMGPAGPAGPSSSIIGSGPTWDYREPESINDVDSTLKPQNKLTLLTNVQKVKNLLTESVPLTVQEIAKCLPSLTLQQVKNALAGSTAFKKKQVGVDTVYSLAKPAKK